MIQWKIKNLSCRIACPASVTLFLAGDVFNWIQMDLETYLIEFKWIKKRI